MNTLTVFLLIMAAVMAWVTFSAWRLGNEKRDIAFLGVSGGLCGAAAAVTTLL